MNQNNEENKLDNLNSPTIVTYDKINDTVIKTSIINKLNTFNKVQGNMNMTRRETKDLRVSNRPSKNEKYSY